MIQYCQTYCTVLIQLTVYRLISFPVQYSTVQYSTENKTKKNKTKLLRASLQVLAGSHTEFKQRRTNGGGGGCDASQCPHAVRIISYHIISSLVLLHDFSGVFQSIISSAPAPTTTATTAITSRQVQVSTTRHK